MNAYQMVLHRPVETARVLGNNRLSLPKPAPSSNSSKMFKPSFGPQMHATLTLFVCDVAYEAILEDLINRHFWISEIRINFYIVTAAQ